MIGWDSADLALASGDLDQLTTVVSCGRRLVVTSEDSVVEPGKNKLVPIIP